MKEASLQVIGGSDSSRRVDEVMSDTSDDEAKVMPAPVINAARRDALDVVASTVAAPLVQPASAWRR